MGRMLAAIVMAIATMTPAQNTLEVAVAEAERCLRTRDVAGAERHYAAALAEGWRLLGAIATADGRTGEAVEALTLAHAAAPDDLEIVFALASGYLRLKQVDEADRLFTTLAAAKPEAATFVLIGRTWRDAGEFDRARAAVRRALTIDPHVRRAHYYLGTIAVMQDGLARIDEAIAELRQELVGSPDDPTTNLRLGMALVEAKRPADALPALEIATRANPRSADAFHYLGRCLLAVDRPKPAVDALRRALALSSDVEPDAHVGARAGPGSGSGLSLGSGSDSGSGAAARSASSSDPGRGSGASSGSGSGASSGSDANRVAGSGQSRKIDAPASTSGSGRDELRLGHMHYQLALALRAIGATDEAAIHFAEAQRASARRADNSRERLARYMADAPDAATAAVARAASPRGDVERQTRTILARCYLNLGIIEAQREQVATAAERFEQAAALDPDLPRVQYSLGVAYFTLGRYDKAAAPLSRALAAINANAANASAARANGDHAHAAAAPGANAASANGAAANSAGANVAGANAGGASARGANAGGTNAPPAAVAIAGGASAAANASTSADVRRMLALAWLNTEAYDKAAELLKDDPRRETDPALQYAYGLALVRSDRAAEAEAIFSRLLASHANTPEVSVVLGMAYGQQGDYPSAIAALQRAIASKADVEDAHDALGVIYLKQGMLADAEAALRAEITAHPSHVQARHHLATVLDLDGRRDEAITLLRGLLAEKPDFADAHYLLGKVLLAQGAAAEAAAELEAAARLSPDEPSIRYQLGQAYLKVGRTAQADAEFARFRALKDQRRGQHTP